MSVINMSGVIEALDASDKTDPVIDIRLENGWLISLEEFPLQFFHEWPLLADVRVQIDVLSKAEKS